MLIAVSTALLVSCLGMDADARIGADGSVDVSMTYTVSAAVDELGRLGANAAYIPVPVGRDDLDLAARRAGGTLRSWSRKDGVESFVVTAALRFPSAAAFASFLDPTGLSASYSESGGKSTLTMRLSEGTPPAEKELVDFIRAAFDDYAVSIRITTPRAPSSPRGFVVAGRVSSFTMKSADLYASDKPVTLSLSW
ncbi:MAG: hypothetical protein CVV47_04740 [Spirochaetae bacterium HGW-Spirochaetae-3]|nr:MAG: hypothetical protein CVV47_04740 [Spirochaetae bacterium HGW-Spirochaetae-3]